LGRGIGIIGLIGCLKNDGAVSVDDDVPTVLDDDMPTPEGRVAVLGVLRDSPRALQRQVNVKGIVAAGGRSEQDQ
jgi:hypothetical protein